MPTHFYCSLTERNAGIICSHKGVSFTITLYLKRWETGKWETQFVFLCEQPQRVVDNYHVNGYQSLKTDVHGY